MGHVKDRWYVTRDGEKVPSDRHGRGLRWQVFLTVDGRVKCGGSFPTKEIAKRKLVDLEAAALRGQWVDPTDQTTVTDLVRAYAAGRHHKPRTAARVESFIVNHVEPLPIGKRRAAVVRPSEAQAWVTDRAQVLAPRTLQLLVTLVRGAFNAAVLDRIVAVNPLARVAMPKVEKGRIVPLTVDQVRMIEAEIGEDYAAMVVTQAGCGLRIGELLALRDVDVDFLRRTVRVEDQIDRLTRERVPPKTATSRRTIPLPGVVAVALAEHLRRRPPGPGGLLFYASTGMPYMHDWYGNRVFGAAVTKVRARLAAETAAAVRDGREPPAPLPAKVTTHDLRHHYASVLLAAGQSVVAVAELLGHENATLVLTTYGHLLPGGEDLARKAIEAAWAATPDQGGESATTQGRPG